jgi:hypothetical protein
MLSDSFFCLEVLLLLFVSEMLGRWSTVESARDHIPNKDVQPYSEILPSFAGRREVGRYRNLRIISLHAGEDADVKVKTWNCPSV